MVQSKPDDAASLLALLLDFEAAAPAGSGPRRLFACFVPPGALDSTTTAGALLAFALHDVASAGEGGGGRVGANGCWEGQGGEGRGGEHDS